VIDEIPAVIDEIPCCSKSLRQAPRHKQAPQTRPTITAEMLRLALAEIEQQQTTTNSSSSTSWQGALKEAITNSIMKMATTLASDLASDLAEVIANAIKTPRKITDVATQTTPRILESSIFHHFFSFQFDQFFFVSLNVIRLSISSLLLFLMCNTKLLHWD
jgi:hypothetical protein